MSATKKQTPDTIRFLNPLDFPLRGSHLIEASAGTGKTFTIAALYVRLVLGVRPGESDTAFQRELVPPEILVVTFTEAATKELRDRIRARLAEAAECFRATAASITNDWDAYLLSLRAVYPVSEWPLCARKLQLAAEWMDEAAVSTIHGWCNRMLREHAFDSNSLFTQELSTDQSSLLDEVIRDYWRIHMYPMGVVLVRDLRKWFATPQALGKALKGVHQHAAMLASAATPQQCIEELRAERARLKQPWKIWADKLKDFLDEVAASGNVLSRKLIASNYTRWIGALREWAEDPELALPELTETAWERLTPEGIAAIWTGASPAPSHPALQAIANLQKDDSALSAKRTDILVHAAIWVAEHFAREQQRRAQMGFNELLTGLNAALKGPNGPRLAEVIRRQFPVALIDEFQDTDSVQYEIFNTVYGAEANDASTALILIGDPKQAIYAFRGADIYTYLQAREAVSGRLHTLKRNFRSTKAMVAAVNACFLTAEKRDGLGAFRFGGTNNPVPFIEADAEGRDEQWQVEGRDMPALTVWVMPAEEEGKPLAKDTYVKTMAAHCAEEMVRLLNQGQSGKAGFHAKGELRRVSPGDMAVLVNTGAEAGHIREALRRRGVRSVYLSDRDSVFGTPEAEELQLWLLACSNPDDGRALRAALATPSIGKTWLDLDRLNQDEILWEESVLQFRQYREVWHRQGVLPMVRRLLNDFDVPARQMAASDRGGERSLTNMLHLAELLQQASVLLEGEHALVRYLAEQRSGGGGVEGDVMQIRLESDANLVKIVTIHKSKGLEYPLVFIPFICAFRGVKAEDFPLKWHDKKGKLQLAMEASDEVLVTADAERLAEDLRKLYVAMTRARFATWMGVAPIRDIERSAFGYVLSGNAHPGMDLVPVVQQHFASCGTACAVEGLDTSASGETFQFHQDNRSARLGKPRVAQRIIPENWWIGSYSALASGSGASTPAPETPNQDVFHEALRDTGSIDSTAPSTVPVPIDKPVGLLHRLPRGADVGTFLHGLLEWAANTGFSAVRQELLEHEVQKFSKGTRWESQSSALSSWFCEMLKTRFVIPVSGKSSFSLETMGSYRAEMEFMLSAHQVEIDQVDAIVCRHIFPAAARPTLQSRRLNGMLKGFIDLVFEADGRFFVVDYKSNYLGSTDEAYTEDAMQQAILNSRYELQYVLYLLALHRLLRLRLPDYDYDQHIGGAVYIFLRGTQARSQGLHFHRPTRECIEALDQLFSNQSLKEAA